MDKVTFYTLGCKVNQYETEAMMKLFEQNGYQIVDDSKHADIYVINTCTVTNLAARKSRQYIRKARKKNQNAIIAAVGCYSQVSPKEVSEVDGIDVMIGTSNKNRIVELCEKVAKNHRKINLVQNVDEIKKFEEMNIDDIKEKTRAFIKIQDGCNQFCSYCIIPYARGRIRSRNLDNIINEVKRIALNGYKEVVLTGIHIASYGKDIGELQLIDVIENIHDIKGIERIRLGSLEPTIITENFMQKLSSFPKACDHFHLSLQSGSKEVLKRMNRKYTPQQYENGVKVIRKFMPNAGITTDIIVGFPGETEEEFNETCDFVKKINFSRVHVFKYSPREGTVASKFKDQIDGNIKNIRVRKLINLTDRLEEKFASKFVPSEVEVLFEEESKDKLDFIEGYTTNYIRVAAKSSTEFLGKIMPVKITRKNHEILIGEIDI